MTFTSTYQHQQHLPTSLPASPSVKRKREVSLHIPVSPAGSCNSAYSSSRASLDEAVSKEPSVGQTPPAGSVAAGEFEVEVPSPRTRVANRLDGLSLGGGGEEIISRKINELKDWRMKKSARGGGSGQFDGWDHERYGELDLDANTQTGGEQTVAEQQEDALLSRKKKKATRVGFGGTEEEILPLSLSSDCGNSTETIRPKSKIKKRVGISAMEFETVEIPETPMRSDMERQERGPGVAFELLPSSPIILPQDQPSPSKRRFRSPPPTRPQEDDMDEDGIPEVRYEDDEDDLTGVNGIGYRPTATQRYARSQKRMEQIREYKARESREARAKRTERRKRGSARSSTSSLVGGGADFGTGFDISESLEFNKRVHFAT